MVMISSSGFIDILVEYEAMGRSFDWVNGRGEN